MSSANIKLTNCVIKCVKGCRNDYDLGKLSLEAKRKNHRNLYCPSCGKRVGILS